MKAWKAICGWVILGLAAGCGIDFGATSIQEPVELAGSWDGSQRDAAGDMHSVTLSFDSSGQLYSYRVDGAETGNTGSAAGPDDSGTLFALRFRDGSRGGLITNDNHTHAALLDQNFNLAVLQRNAPPPTPFVEGDVVQPAWWGVYVDVDDQLEYRDRGGALLEVAADRSFTGTDANVRLFQDTSPLSLADAAFGLFTGAFVNVLGPAGAGPLVMLVSPDRSHAAGYTCSPDESAFPLGCRYYLWGQ